MRNLSIPEFSVNSTRKTVLGFQYCLYFCICYLDCCYAIDFSTSKRLHRVQCCSACKPCNIRRCNSFQKRKGSVDLRILVL
ncbi:uncharacterized protein BDZ99DRAFT_269553 [Mytilinidion resinicola]|uniref:Uncharacterized protein n=1 Tax=Mytilinidion resinicola TaxID=574789 RepID=A0A6A6YVM0_9PEZI|nr:uncharacterized protein BDZ99DRAFT_269553 [Mytilinidion resinicola]KAF2812569.1 hypothetical protein BDZ99DRAFT_269553 [Mytilinidion resinicola]